jgi:hypothetical protein
MTGSRDLTVHPADHRVTSSCRHAEIFYTDMTRPDRIGKKTVQALVTVEKWKKLRHVVTETQRTGDDLLSEAIDMLAEKYPPPAARKPPPRRPSHG